MLKSCLLILALMLVSCSQLSTQVGQAGAMKPHEDPPPPPPDPPPCTDTDGGLNFDVPGIAAGLMWDQELTDEPREGQDQCTSQGLREYYCSQYDYLEVYYHECDAGCSFGACN